MKKVFTLVSVVLVTLFALASKDIWYWQDGVATKLTDVDSITFVDPETIVEPVVTPEDTLFPEVTEKAFTIGDFGIKMIPVKGGTFMMGAQNTDSTAANYDPNAFDNEAPVHEVTLKSYWIAETECTEDILSKFVSTIYNETTDDTLRPAHQLTYDDIQEFLDSLNAYMHRTNQLPASANFSLPTEAQWEFAAKGGNLSKGYLYSGSDSVRGVAVTNKWEFEDSFSDVKTKQPNELGIYDMSGNLMEYCDGYYSDYADSAQVNPQDAQTGEYRILRGGNYYDSYVGCRNTWRGKIPASANPSNNIGFRIVLNYNEEVENGSKSQSQEIGDTTKTNPSASGSFYGAYLLMKTIVDGDTTDNANDAPYYFVLKPDTLQEVGYDSTYNGMVSVKYVGSYDESNKFTFANPFYNFFIDNVGVVSYTDSTLVYSYGDGVTERYYILKRINALPDFTYAVMEIYTADGYVNEGGTAGDEDDDEDDDDEEEDDSTDSGTSETPDEVAKTYSLTFPDFVQTLYSTESYKSLKVTTDNVRKDFTMAVKGMSGDIAVADADVECYTNYNYDGYINLNFDMPDSAGFYYISATDPNGIEYKSDTFEVIDTPLVTIAEYTEDGKFYFDLDNGVAYTESDLSDSDILASIDLVLEGIALVSPDKCSNATVAATGNSIKFWGDYSGLCNSTTETSLSDTGYELQFKTSNGTEGLMVFVSRTYEYGTETLTGFSFNYQLKK